MYKRYRSTVLEVYLQNIVDNYQALADYVDNKTVIPVIKADAYGHGAVKVCQALIDHGVTFFAVSLLEEALELREHFETIDILVMGVVDADALPVMAKHRLACTVYEESFAEDVLAFHQPLNVHLKVDTGMNRLGFKNHDAIKAFASRIETHKTLTLEGIYTHFASSDGHPDFTALQAERFKHIVQALPKRPKVVHIANTSGAINIENQLDFTTHVRSGILLFGSTFEKGFKPLKTASALKTRIVQIKHLKAGEHVGYNITYTASEDEIIGVLPIGYADGFLRKHQGGNVSINGKRYPIVGRVCMDQSFIKIDASISKDDSVIMYGDDVVTIEAIAKQLDTITYEAFCLISKRVPRVYPPKEES